MSDDYQLIQQCIDRAVAAEQARGRFRRSLHDTLPSLHRSIHLPPRDAPLHITCFVIRYIQAIPGWLQRLDEMCHAGGLNFHPVRELVLHSFSEIPERQPHEHGLGSILDEAYLAHRTMEEINDLLQPLCGTPLLPMDPMVANLVVRELLGESLACQLDDLANILLQRFELAELDPARLVSMILHKQRYEDTPGEWPDFAHHMQIEMRPPSLPRHVDLSH
ncbi:hypothetical protein [Microbulbifer hydrolyticus]|uniref:Uncharacterized protein n=1 Tax=Microbulbifer hydrolyticus TaxID=48074 RepID=A0A6P1THB6_9GAMM|nr:hypothetical protein [Microbulbifer hydrolyticus]MBB5211798.1 hypothetical protein [Microbulbifer hydrolyticus]QHQ40609.1 hypothetical protein GTQ55_17570 [Microbulbifer hydrolyticus]